MLAAAREVHQLLYEDEEFQFDIPFIHYAYSLIQNRLVNFSNFVHAFPDVVKEMLKLRDRLNVGEMVRSILNHVGKHTVFKRLIFVESLTSRVYIGVIHSGLESLDHLVLLYSF